MNHIIEIPIEYLSDFRRSPQRSERDLQARPSLAIEGFFDEETIREKCNMERESPLTESGKFKEWFVCTDEEPRSIHIDLATKRDCVGIAMGKRDGFVTVGDEERVKIYIDLMMQIKPEGEIQISDIREIIYEIQKRGFHIRIVTLDSFQSVDTIQIFKNKGIPSDLLSVDKDLGPYQALKEAIYEDRCDYYYFEPFIMECSRLELIRGVKVDHAPNSSKDVSDSIAGVCFNIVTMSRAEIDVDNIPMRVPPGMFPEQRDFDEEWGRL